MERLHSPFSDQPETKKIATQNDSFASMMGGMGAMSAPQRSASEEFKGSDGMVGFIIGRGGEQISRMQQESGCKIQISPDSGGMPDRSAKRLLTEVVERRPAPVFHHSDGPGMTVKRFSSLLLKLDWSLEKEGETIKQLQDRAGVKMVMIQDGTQNTGADKPLRITGEPF
ncbi:hypothetical protein AAFF_G00189190 [Aldrovandia affinis]|uniref:K Homology domain-containing protein n=1 Tax=Aldrovandia affinis TaxID=143900 RepID=A0AAD7R049_9TELE|nr:hypothetical protein AAFF_G00189190 [Aldrovandia affinis]